MKEEIKNLITAIIQKLYPDVDIRFSVDYAPAGIDADFASNAALILARAVGDKPMKVASQIASSLSTPRNDGMIANVAPPGFLNFKLPPSAWQDALKEIVKLGKKYGTGTQNKGKKARVEYVSANPTGPLHIGNARGGPYGETICKILESTGYKVLREYLHNDIGGQVEKLGQTLWYWYHVLRGKKAEFPEGGYQGEYLQEVVKAATAKLGEELQEKDLPKLTKFALDYIYKENMQTLKKLGIEFDLVVKESELKRKGLTTAAVDELNARGLTRKKEGALWFAPNDEFLEDQEAVIIKSNGETTYFASDIAYHKEKFSSGYDLVVDVFGSNHHGHVPKLLALTKIYNFPSGKFTVLLYQFVRVKRGQEVVKMSKRAGNYVTAKEVLEEVGASSMLFTLLMTAVNTHVDFDLELARDTSEKNPVFRVQYAHARCNSIFKKVKNSPFPSLPALSEVEGIKEGRKGGEFRRKPVTIGSGDSIAALQNDKELELIRELAKFPDLVSEIIRTYEVHRLPHYLLALADKFHSFYEKIRVISEDKKLTHARLALVEGVRTVLANGLRLMGIIPLEKM